MNTGTAARITARINESMRLMEATLDPADREPSARQCLWECEDGYFVSYTTGRVVGGGALHGKFLTLLYRPAGRGARSGNATEAVKTYQRAFSTRKAARKRALQLYRQHSPRWAAKHPQDSEPSDDQILHGRGAQ